MVCLTGSIKQADKRGRHIGKRDGKIIIFDLARLK